MRRVVLITLIALPAGLLLAGCGSQGVVGPTPVKVVGTLPKATVEPATPAFKLKGDPVAGKKIFQEAACGSCHTLSDANATGTVGPNLDQAQPDYRLATARITLGKAGMPSFKGQLSDQQIADVASYVVKATTGENPGTTEP
jgi:mono/diheme cytochrome c family protein